MNTSLMLMGVTVAMSGNQYRCIVTNPFGSTTSNAATLTVLSLPVITEQPTNQSAIVGQNAAFTILATGSPDLTFQWQSSSNGAI
jgi:hypothetical protein